MKSNIHPVYGPVVFQDNSNGKQFLMRSTLAARKDLPRIHLKDGNDYPLVVTEVTSTSHPFYTGRSMVIDTAGQVQKFQRRYGIGE